MTDKFPLFAKAVKGRFDVMSREELYTVNVARDELFELYLASFPAGTDPIYRVRTEHDGSYDRAFIRNVGHVVILKGGVIDTLWNIKGLPHPYDVVAKALHELVLSRAVTSIFRTVERKFSMESNIELKDGVTTKFYHFHAEVASRHQSSTPDADRGSLTTSVGVFRRGMEELRISSIDDVLDLINANSIYRGAEFKSDVEAFKKLHREYPRLGSQADKDLFLWQNIKNRSALLRNSVIGTLIVDLSNLEDLDKSVRAYEKKVAPENYKRTSSLITPKMIEQAVDKLKELGLESAVNRRFAKLADVSVNNVLFVDNAVKPQMKDGLTGLLMSSVKPSPVDIKKTTPISMEEFLENVVPNARGMKVLVENKHLSNFMSITAPVDPNAGKLFKWDNQFAWSYDGDVTDSIKDRVKKAGGNIDAPLRVSLAWHNADDLDLHASCPEGHVYYSQKKGILDVDMNGLDKRDEKAPVENLSWRTVRDGPYQIAVHQYSQRKREDGGFEVEFFFNGETKTFSYPKIVNQSERIELVSFQIKNGQLTNFKAGNLLSATSGSMDKWGVASEQLVPVNTLMASPNHWDDQTIGNKHWFFILKDCVNPDQVRGIYNEYLKGELEPHRKVFEVLGAKTKCPPAAEQLSGVGFSSTRQDKAVVVVDGDSASRAYEISF